MFRDALRRLLWLGPTLFVVTIPTFWAVARATDHASGPPSNPLPLFFNPDPAGARERAEGAARRLATGGGADAAGELSRLGGAALPYVLPLFDALNPDARVRVALSLAPIARRMGIGSSAEVDSPETVVLFWTRFWEEHSIDFRPAAVARSVRRFAEHPSPLRRTEVEQLDTFALEELISAMSPPKTAADVARLRPLVDAAAHATGVPLTVGPGATVAEATAVVKEWRVFWLANRGDYVAFTGTRRLGATLRETRYVRWLEQLQKEGLGKTADGTSVTTALRASLPVTLFLVLSALVAGYPLALFAGLSRVLGRRRWVFGPLATALLVLSATPVGLSGFLLRGARATPSLGLAGIVMALTSAALASRHARALHDRAAEQPYVRTPLAFGASPLHVAVRAVRVSLPMLLAHAVSDLPSIATTAFVVERAFSLRGLGAATTLAARTGDLTWLMAVAVLGAFTLGVAQIAGDLAAGLLDPRRARPATVRRRRE